jgi:hypothetical protein
MPLVSAEGGARPLVARPLRDAAAFAPLVAVVAALRAVAAPTDAERPRDAAVEAKRPVSGSQMGRGGDMQLWRRRASVATEASQTSGPAPPPCVSVIEGPSPRAPPPIVIVGPLAAARRSRPVSESGRG